LRGSSAIARASARSRLTLVKAAVKSPGLLTSRGISVSPSARPDSRFASRPRASAGFVGFQRMPTREVFGATSLSSSSRLAKTSRPASCVSPVRLPPGRARLATSPVPTGSPASITMGIVKVACLAANDAGVPNRQDDAHLSWTSSAARSGSRATLPSAYRDSNVRFWPGIHPSSTSAAGRRAGPRRGSGWRVRADRSGRSSPPAGPRR